MKKKILALTLVFALALALGIGGTVAWLTDKTDSVVNTFTVGDINITLTESENLNLKMVPGNDITKDPKVTVLKDSEACWLFVKIDESTEPKLSDFVTYSVATGWTELENGVYYRKVNAVTVDTTFDILSDNKVTVNNTVTKAMLNGLDTNGDGIYSDTELPKLTFTAYAIQSSNLKNTDNTAATTAAQAWALISH